MIPAASTFTTANALVRKEPIFLLTIAGYSRVFSNKSGYGTDTLIEAISDLSTTVSDLDGGADQRTLTVTVQDGTQASPGLITADFPGFTFEGKKATLSTGFKGMSSTDFLPIFTGVIDTVASSNSNTCYDFNITDDLLWTMQVIFSVGDSGLATDSTNPKTINAHPLDLLISIIKNELNRSSLEYNESNILAYRDTVFAGLQFSFEITSPPQAQDFIEQQIMQPLGGYLFTNYLGQLDVHFPGPLLGPAIEDGSCVGCFTNGSGVIVGTPFLVGFGCSVIAPPGATQLQIGMADTYYGDNVGLGWFYSVFDDTASTTLSLSFHSGANEEPWDPSINPSFSFTNGGATAPPTLAVTAGHIIRLVYGGGTASIGFGGLAGPLGPGGLGVTSSSPAWYCYSPTPVQNVFAITEDNTIGPPKNDIPAAGQAELINQISIRFDADSGGGSYHSEFLANYAPSISLYTQYGQHIIQSDGMRSGLQGFSLAAQTSNFLFQRYGNKNLYFDNCFVLDWRASVLEIGDEVAVTNRFIPDRVAGVIGITAKKFEVMGVDHNFNDGTVTLSLLDVGLNLYTSVYIAPAGEADYASAAAYDQGHYMFMCDNTDKYSTGATGNKLS
jgi:hypothetical protein